MFKFKDIIEIKAGTNTTKDGVYYRFGYGGFHDSEKSYMLYMVRSGFTVDALYVRKDNIQKTLDASYNDVENFYKLACEKLDEMHTAKIKKLNSKLLNQANKIEELEHELKTIRRIFLTKD